MRKNVVLGLIEKWSKKLWACTSVDNSKVESLEETISSLENENADLKEQLSKEEASSEKSSSQSTSESGQETNGNQLFGLNEEAIIRDSSGKEMYSLKIIKATTNLTVNDDFYTDGKPDNTVEVTYEYKNYNYESPMLISSQFMEAFDQNNYAGKNMSMMDGQTEVSQGRSSQSTIWFVMNDVMIDKGEIEIEYVNDFSLGFDGVVKFRVPLEH